MVPHLPTRQGVTRSKDRDLVGAGNLRFGEQCFELGIEADLDVRGGLRSRGRCIDLPGQADRVVVDADQAVRILRSKIGDGCHACPSEGQPLTAPAVTPSTILRLKKMNISSGGMVMRRTSMNSRFHCESNWFWKLNSVSCTVAVSDPGVK